MSDYIAKATGARHILKSADVRGFYGTWCGRLIDRNDARRTTGGDGGAVICTACSHNKKANELREQARQNRRR